MTDKHCTQQAYIKRGSSYIEMVTGRWHWLVRLLFAIPYCPASFV